MAEVAVSSDNRLIAVMIPGDLVTHDVVISEPLTAVNDGIPAVISAIP